MHGLGNRVIVEANTSGASLREYIWLGDQIVGVFANANTASPTIYWVVNDHLGRPIQMRDDTRAVAWEATYKPFGEVVSVTGPASLDARFPGQWFQLESGLAYNWHRHYDASIGRYTQPDPLGFVDGPGVYGYVRQNPLGGVDPDGRCPWCFAFAIGAGTAFFWPEPANAPGICEAPIAADPAKPYLNGLMAGSTWFLGAARPAMLSRMSAAGAQADRNMLTRAGRALQKHGDRPGSSFPASSGSPTMRNQQGQRVLNEILQSPNSRVSMNSRKGTVEIRDKAGRGARFGRSNEFIGFLEP